jgi:hypothetical protein
MKARTSSTRARLEPTIRGSEAELEPMQCQVINDKGAHKASLKVRHALVVPQDEVEILVCVSSFGRFYQLA